MGERDGFIFYRSFYEAISKLKSKDKLAALEAICEYALNGNEIASDGNVAAVICLIKPQIDANNQRYENGKKGGRPPKEKTESKPNENQTETKENQTGTTAEPKEKEKEKVKDKEKVKEKVKEKENTEEIAQPEAAPAITLPLNDGTEYPVYAEQIAEWSELYPAVDIMQQLRSMRGWLIGNPKKRKTKNGILRFITSWLAREQDKGGAVLSQRQKQFTPASKCQGIKPSPSDSAQMRKFLEKLKEDE